MRRIVGIIGALFLVCLIPFAAFGAEYPDAAQAVIDQAPVEADRFLNMEPGEWAGYFWEKAKEPFLAPVKALTQAALYLIMVCLSQALISSGAFQDVLKLVGTLGFAQLSCQQLGGLLAGMEETSLAWHSYLCGFIPIFSGIMAMGGQTASAGVYGGLFLGLSGLLAQGITQLLIPGVKIYIAVSVGAQLWGNQGIRDGTRMIYKGVNWLLKGICILCAGVLGLQGMLSQNMDKAVSKGGQALVNLFLPVVGDLAAQAIAGVAAGIRVLKGTLAFAAIGTIFIEFLPVMAGCISGIVLFWILSACAKSCGLGQCGGLSEAFAEGIQLCLSGMVLYFVLVLSVTLMMAVMGGAG